MISLPAGFKIMHSYVLLDTIRYDDQLSDLKISYLLTVALNP